MRSWFYAEVDGEPANAAAVKEFARGEIEGAMEHLNSLLGDGRQYLIVNQLSTADFLALMLMRWTRNMPRPATLWRNLMRYIQRLRGKQMFVKLNTREGLTEWLNQTP
ncbi:glutathione S-transferase family protein [Burkholderia ambifaria]|uniref:Glutathione S-transferase-like protein n=1 Tax=Burkholderia ambifaria MEX-5 TaxID=396597 RepID=B1TF66_9BURK|nr:glutathione S-transferase family protein [Burkholderia ambifaria]EDT37788.1 glutathione S-transferase-like protein [Burkholderia ambifaria MEX-5]